MEVLHLSVPYSLPETSNLSGGGNMNIDLISMATVMCCHAQGKYSRQPH